MPRAVFLSSEKRASLYFPIGDDEDDDDEKKLENNRLPSEQSFFSPSLLFVRGGLNRPFYCT